MNYFDCLCTVSINQCVPLGLLGCFCAKCAQLIHGNRQHQLNFGPHLQTQQIFIYLVAGTFASLQPVTHVHVQRFCDDERELVCWSEMILNDLTNNWKHKSIELKYILSTPNSIIAWAKSPCIWKICAICSVRNDWLMQKKVICGKNFNRYNNLSDLLGISAPCYTFIPVW